MFSAPNTLVTSHPEWIKLLNTPHSYQLLDEAENKEDTERTFYIIGDAGDLQVAQRQVAELMNRVSSAKRKPFAIILLGDNFYENTLQSPNDPAFKKSFYQVYHQASLEGICDVPFFVILGNHDYNLHFLWQNRGMLDQNTMGMQVMHTYVDENGKVDDNKLALYQSPSLNLSQLPQWNMPSRFYAWSYHGVDFYFIDSNTYIKDYLRSLKNPQEENNQAIWLQTEYAKNPQHAKLLFSHHALTTMGKRHSYTANSLDTRTYLTTEEIEELKKLNIEGSYGAMLKAVLESQALSFSTVFAAHDHAMYYYLNDENERFCQIVSGGGGGKLQARECFQQWKMVPAFLKENGFVAVTFDTAQQNKVFQFDFFGIEKSQLRFTSQNVDPLRKEALSEDVIKLRNPVLAAYENYIDHLRARQAGELEKGVRSFINGLMHRDAGVVRSDALRNYFNQYEKISFNEAVQFVIQSFGPNPKRNDNSLLTYFEKALVANYQINWETFLANPAAILNKMPDREEKSSPSFTPKNNSNTAMNIALTSSLSVTPKQAKTVTWDRTGQSSQDENAISSVPLGIGSPVTEDDSSLTERIVTHFFQPSRFLELRFPMTGSKNDTSKAPGKSSQ